MAERRDVIILGSTGSIGRQALDVIDRNPGLFRVVGLSAGGGQPDLLAEQARRHDVSDVALGEDESADLAARPADVVLNALAGAAGLLPTLRALEAGTALALANKESLIIGGPLVRERARPGQIRPVDSEHSALAQCLMGGTRPEVSRLILTASGGPFRGWTREQLSRVTVDQALAHPTWSMGPLVTINSSTLVNKGLEVIEAHLLFDIPFDRIDVVVHPQSVVHSMVEFTDGSTLAQASPPDMRNGARWEPSAGRRGPGLRLVDGGDLGVPSGRPRRLPGPGGGAARRDRGRDRPRGLQRRRRGLCGGVPRGTTALSRHRRCGLRRAGGAPWARIRAGERGPWEPRLLRGRPHRRGRAGGRRQSPAAGRGDDRLVVRGAIARGEGR